MEPYQIIKRGNLGTYLLKNPNRNVIFWLINSNQLINVRILQKEISTTIWLISEFYT